MRATRTIGALGAIAILGAVVAGGVVAAKAPLTAAQTTIVAYSGDGGILQQYSLSNQDHDEMTLTVSKDRLFNANGRRIGAFHCQCFVSSLAWSCTGEIVLNGVGNTGVGTITVAGIFKGFNGESLAITGGTGAYAGAEGTVKLTVEDGRFVREIKFVQ